MIPLQEPLKGYMNPQGYTSTRCEAVAVLRQVSANLAALHDAGSRQKRLGFKGLWFKGLQDLVLTQGLAFAGFRGLGSRMIQDFQGLKLEGLQGLGFRGLGFEDLSCFFFYGLPWGGGGGCFFGFQKGLHRKLGVSWLNPKGPSTL